MALQKPLLGGKEAATGRPQNNHWCFAPVTIYKSWVLPKSRYHNPTHQLGKWSREGKALTETTRTWKSQLSILQLASSSKRHTPVFPKRCHVKGDLLCCFSFVPWWHHGLVWCLFDEQALALSSCCWHQSLQGWLAQLLQQARTGCLPLPQCQLSGGARHQAGRSNGSMHLKSHNAGPCSGDGHKA